LGDALDVQTMVAATHARHVVFRAMKLAYLSVLGASLATALITSACGEDGDTVIAVNVSSPDAVGVVAALNVTITQQGNSFMTTLTPPTETKEEGPDDAKMMVTSIQNAWYERITLDGWGERPTIVSITGADDRGNTFEDATEVEVVPNGAVAAFLELAVPPAPEMPAEPADGAGGSGGSPAAPGAGGAGGAHPAEAPAGGGAGGTG
jgi:hypothetical protein